MRFFAAAFSFGLCALSLSSGEAFAWGATGHRLIGEIAMRSLPLEMPQFLRSPEAARQIGEVAREPDRSRGAGEPHDFDANPGHYVNAGDDLKILRGPLLSALPPTRDAYDAALRAAGTSQYQAGYLPYAIMESWQQVAVDLAYWRADVAGARHAVTPAERSWFLKDQYMREGLMIRDLGFLAHFVGDGSQPMHVSVHADGWGNFPNPQAFSTEKGLHARFEGAFVRTNIAAKDVLAHVMPYHDCDCAIARRVPYRDCGCAMERRVSDYLIATQKELIAVYQMERQGEFDGKHDSGKLFVSQRLAAGAAELRDVIVDAWRRSAEMSVGYPPIAVSDIESGKTNALNSLQGID